MDDVLLAKDKQFIWHPFTQHHNAPPPLLVTKAEGAYLWTQEGRKLFDAISSWWVNLHGHSHPYIIAKVSEQFHRLDQVIFAGVSHEPAILLSERILSLLPANFHKVFFSDNGSTAVEVALKMAMQYWANRGTPRRRILAFRHGYHGDTFGAMAVSARSAFTRSFWPLLFETDYIDPPLRQQPAEKTLCQLKALLEERGREYAAFIYEPLVQGAGGMLMQEAKALEACLASLKRHGILCIADEVMTGFGRTGKLFASQHCDSQPDIICLAKGLTGGSLPLSLTACSEEIYIEFLSDSSEKTFFHGHSFTANPLGCAAAHASLDLLLTSECEQAIRAIIASQEAFASKLKSSPLNAAFGDIRVQGTILACEFKNNEQTGYFNSLRQAFDLCLREHEVLLRPLGNVVYCLPPYCSTPTDLQKAYEAIEAFARKLL